jgi:ubiquinone/menaquinone biosynthesis C-methylase UbiE
MPTADEIRSAQREMWDKSAPGWERWDRVVLATIGPVGEEMIRSLGIAEDQQHLDVAAGTGEPGLTIARLAPRGHVVLADLAPEMLAAAGRRAAAFGIDNIEIRECSADDLPFSDASFDSVSCRFGFMFFPDLAQVAAEFARVLEPGGRVCASVWAEPEHNAWATIPGRVIATEVETPPPDPDAPGMFRCAAPGAISALFEAVGLRDVTEWDVPTVMITESPEEYWHLLTELTAPVVALLAQVDDDTQQRIASKVMDEARAFESDGTVALPGMARCIIGTK